MSSPYFIRPGVADEAARNGILTVRLRDFLEHKVETFLPHPERLCTFVQLRVNHLNLVLFLLAAR